MKAVVCVLLCVAVAHAAAPHWRTLSFDPHPVEGQQPAQKIGEGAFGEVKWGKCIADTCPADFALPKNSIVAIKEVNAKVGGESRHMGAITQQMVDNNFKEAAIALSMSEQCGAHHVVHTYDAFTSTKAGNTPYLNIAMEILPGGAPNKLRDGQLAGDANRAVKLWKQMIEAVTCVNHAGVIHRDVKAANFMMSADGETVKLGDFGESLGMHERAITISKPTYAGWHEFGMSSCHATAEFMHYSCDQKLRREAGDRVVSWDEMKRGADSYGLAIALLETYYAEGYAKLKDQIVAENSRRFITRSAPEMQAMIDAGLTSFREAVAKWDAHFLPPNHAAMPEALSQLIFDFWTGAKRAEDVDLNDPLFAKTDYPLERPIEVRDQPLRRNRNRNVNGRVPRRNGGGNGGGNIIQTNPVELKNKPERVKRERRRVVVPTKKN